MPETPPVVLSIAGFDPSSGAGVTADIKTIAAHGCYGVACITSLTVQSTQGVRRVEACSSAVVAESLKELAQDIEIEAVHIGMLGSAQVAATVAQFVADEAIRYQVLDPVLRSSSGTALVDAEGERVLRQQLLPQASVITPNIDEASVLTGLPVTNLAEMKSAAHRLHEMGAKAVVITGGHLEKATDLLSFRTNKGIEQEVFTSEKSRSKSTHGTGCAFSTAMACHLALDRGLPEAVLLSKAYISAAIAKAYPLGKGIGPPNHLYRMHQQKRGASPPVEKEAMH